MRAWCYVCLHVCFVRFDDGRCLCVTFQCDSGIAIGLCMYLSVFVFCFFVCVASLHVCQCAFGFPVDFNLRFVGISAVLC